MKNEWQPIETAPKDGTVILAFDGIYFACIEYFPSIKEWAVCGGSKLNSADDEFREPTHWMPIPPHPDTDNLPKYKI